MANAPKRANSTVNNRTRRIAVIGPESTGKSTLCAQLADHYKTEWVREYARVYLTERKGPYKLNDIETIYRHQFGVESSLLEKKHLVLFTDTEFIIGKVWCEHAFGICPGYFDRMIHEHPYDLYLLTFPDLPWEPDPLREHPGEGLFFFNWYERILKERGYVFGVVRGEGEQRLSCAIDIVDKYFAAPFKPEG